MTSDEPVAIIDKNSREDVRVTLSDYRGDSLIDVRIWADYSAGAAQARGPTKKGVSLKVDRLADLITGLQQAQAEARRRGLLTD